MRWKWKAVVVDRIEYPPDAGGQPSALYNYLDNIKKQEWIQVGYDPNEDVFIFRRLMNNEEEERVREKEKQLWEMIRR